MDCANLTGATLSVHCSWHGIYFHKCFHFNILIKVKMLKLKKSSKVVAPFTDHWHNSVCALLL